MNKTLFGLRIHEHCRGYWVLRRVEHENGCAWFIEYHNKSTNDSTRQLVTAIEVWGWGSGYFFNDNTNIPKIVKHKAYKVYREYLNLVNHLNTGKFI